MANLGSSYYSEEELTQSGFKFIGKNVQIDKSCNIIGTERISIEDNVRIDGFTTITVPPSGYLTIGSYIHIAGYCLLACSYGITMGDFSAISHGTKLYTASDDYSGRGMTNPTIPIEYRSVKTGSINIGKYGLIGAMCVVLPGADIPIGTSVGAMSKVVSPLEEWSVYNGNPAVKIKDRKRNMIEHEKNIVGGFNV